MKISQYYVFILSLFMLLVIFVSLSGYKVCGTNDNNGNIGLTSMGNTLIAYAFLLENDKIYIDIDLSKSPDSNPINYTIIFIEYATGKKWSWSTESYASRPLGPVFIVPKTGFYIMKLSVKGVDNVIINAHIGIEPYKYRGLIFFEYTFPFFLLILLLLFSILIMNYVFGHGLFKSTILLITEWELNSWYKYLLSLAYVIIAVPSMLFVGSGFSPSFYPSYHGSINVYRFFVNDLILSSGGSHLWFITYILSLILLLMMFNYEVETGIYRNYLACWPNRSKLLGGKLFALLLLLSVVPLIKSLTVSMYFTDFLVSNHIEIFLEVLLAELIIGFIYLFSALGLALVLSILPINSSYIVFLGSVLPFIYKSLANTLKFPLEELYKDQCFVLEPLAYLLHASVFMVLVITTMFFLIVMFLRRDYS